MNAATRDRALGVVEAAAGEIIAAALAVCRIPAPTFHEGERAGYACGRMAAAGLADVHVDAAGNAVGVRRGQGSGPTILLAAHTDTVFPPGHTSEPTFDGLYWRAPGVRDNSASVGVLLTLPRLLDRAGLELPGDVIFAANSGEEGLGDLRGMRALMSRWGGRVDGVLVVDGSLGHITHQGICVRRLEVTGRTRGGHSWGNYGVTSAIHVLARMVAQITRLEPPAEPKTTLNVGTFSGGTSVNSIAESASFLLDMRSMESATLAALEQQVRGVLAAEGGAPDLELAVQVVSDRPGGRIAPEHPLVRAVVRALDQIAIQPRLSAGSTDANIPLSMGIPACTCGVSTGGGVHTLAEYLDPTSLVPGTKALLLSLAAAMESLPKRAS